MNKDHKQNNEEIGHGLWEGKKLDYKYRHHTQNELCGYGCGRKWDEQGQPKIGFDDCVSSYHIPSIFTEDIVKAAAKGANEDQRNLMNKQNDERLREVSLNAIFTLLRGNKE